MLDAILLRIAKSAIYSKFDKDYNFDKEKLLKEYPFLSEDGAVFVTLNKQNQLRGCIGSIIAHRPLLEDILHNANAAAFSDPRFEALDAHELAYLHLEVSLLSKPEVLEYIDFDDLMQKVRPHKDGLILKYGSYQGTFLPQVWEQLPNPKDFLHHLSLKAGTNPSVYDNKPTIYRYEVNAIEEDYDEILPL